MKKTFTNGTIYTMAQVLFGAGSGDGQIVGLVNKKNLKSRMAVRHALKFNYTAIANAYQNISEMINDIRTELFEGFKENGKTHDIEDGFEIEKGYVAEFQQKLTEKVDELLTQTLDVDIVTIPQKEFDTYTILNDGELTEMELDILEIFVEPEKEETPKGDDVNE